MCIPAVVAVCPRPLTTAYEYGLFALHGISDSFTGVLPSVSRILTRTARKQRGCIRVDSHAIANDDTDSGRRVQLRNVASRRLPATGEFSNGDMGMGRKRGGRGEISIGRALHLVTDVGNTHTLTHREP